MVEPLVLVAPSSHPSPPSPQTNPCQTLTTIKGGLLEYAFAYLNDVERACRGGDGVATAYVGDMRAGVLQVLAADDDEYAQVRIFCGCR